MQVDGQLVNTRITTTLVYEAAKRVFGMSFTVDKFSLQVRGAACAMNVAVTAV